MLKIIQLVRTSRLRKTLNWNFIFLGYLLSRNFNISLPDFFRLFKVYLILGLLMYGGLYSINTYADRKRDRRDEKTSTRLLASGLINSKEVLIWGCILTALSLVLGVIFTKDLLIFQLILIFINLAYSFYLKDTYCFFAIPAVALTGPIKVMIGVFLTGTNILDFSYLYTVHYMMSMSFHTIKWVRRPYLNKFGVMVLRKVSFITGSLFTLVCVFQLKLYVLIFYLPTLINSSLIGLSSAYRKKVFADWDRD